MSPQEFRTILRQTLEDRRISRNERRALALALEEIHPNQAQLDLFRHEAFDLAREELNGPLTPTELVDWLEDVIRLLKPQEDQAPTLHAEAHFSPGTNCRSRIRQLFMQCRNTADVCVFTITDNDISETIAGAHNRGVRIRIITDDDKSFDRGSDIERLSELGIEVRIDNSPHHMHHKFAIFDESILLSGSYNWTRSAAENNEENIVVMGDRPLVNQFQSLFEDLWTKFGP